MATMDDFMRGRMTSPIYSPGPARGAPSYGYQGYSGYESGPGYGSPTGYGGDRTGGTGGGAWRGVGRWITSNPEAVLGALGTGLGYLGARQQRKQEEEQFNRRYGLEERGQALSEAELQARLEADKAEQERRRRAIMQIMGMDRERRPVSAEGAVQMGT